MTVQDVLFYLFAIQALVGGWLVVANPFSCNPVACAMALILTILALAGEFVLLQAYFLAAVQVIIYAGAVIVLFLFVIMVLGLDPGSRPQFRKSMVVGGLVGAGTIAAILISVILNAHFPAAIRTVEGSAKGLGQVLFREYVLPFELVSLILLIAVVGVVWLSRRKSS